LADNCESDGFFFKVLIFNSVVCMSKVRGQFNMVNVVYVKEVTLPNQMYYYENSDAPFTVSL